MKRTPHTQEFREQALRKVRARGQRMQQSIAQELNIFLAGRFAGCPMEPVPAPASTQ